MIAMSSAAFMASTHASARPARAQLLSSASSRAQRDATTSAMNQTATTIDAVVTPARIHAGSGTSSATRRKSVTLTIPSPS